MKHIAAVSAALLVSLFLTGCQAYPATRYTSRPGTHTVPPPAAETEPETVLLENFSADYESLCGTTLRLMAAAYKSGSPNLHSTLDNYQKSFASQYADLLARYGLDPSPAPDLRDEAYRMYQEGK